MGLTEIVFIIVAVVALYFIFKIANIFWKIVSSILSGALMLFFIVRMALKVSILF